jgi:hypothetical protein
MKKTPPCSANAIARPRSVLHHVTLNTGHVVEHDLEGAHALSVCEFLPLLETGVGDIPGMPGFAFAFKEVGQSCQFVLAFDDVELIAGGLDWGSEVGDSLWCWLSDYYHRAVPRVPGWRTSCPATPPPLPWLAVVLTENIRLIPSERARMLGAVERDLAWALIYRSQSRN